MSDGTSNATTFTITLPFNASVAQKFVVPVRNSGAWLTTPGTLNTRAASNIADVWRNTDQGTTTWTASGGKLVSGTILYLMQ